MENMKKIVGENLSELRKSKKITQFELANLFNYSDKAVSKWENGETLPDIETLSQLATYYGVTLDYLTHPVDENKQMYIIQDDKKQRINHAIITALISSVVWIIATIIFVYILIKNNKTYWLSFIWAIPLNNMIIFVSNKRIFKSRKLGVVNSSIFVWSLISGTFLQVMDLNAGYIWPLFLIGIPLQISIILWYLHVKMK